jgi:hypothetical protein
MGKKKQQKSANRQTCPPVSIAELRKHSTVGLETAAGVLGIGRTKAYELARTDEFPCPVIKVGHIYRVAVPGLLDLLGAEPA